MKKLTLTLATASVILGAYCTYADLIIPQDKDAKQITITKVTDAVNMKDD